MENRCCVAAYAESAHNQPFRQALSPVRISNRLARMKREFTEINPKARIPHALAVSFLGLTGIALYEQFRRIVPLPSTRAIVKPLDGILASSPQPDPIPIPIDD